MLTDEQIVRRIQSGDNEAFRELVSRYRGKVYGVAYHVSRDEKEAEDIAQEVFVQVYRSLRDFRLDSRFSTWIYRIAMNKALDWKRKNRRVTDRFADVERMDKRGGGPDPHLDALLTRQEVREALQKLPEKYRRVIELYYFQDCSYGEIADALNIAVKSVESRLYRGRNLLRKQWEKEEC